MVGAFHYFTLEEIFEYAEAMGYAREDVEVRVYEQDEAYVSFGQDSVEEWSWSFDNGIQAPATDYEHNVWTD